MWILISAALCSNARLEERFAPVQFSREYETSIHMRSAFVHAAQSVSTLMSSSPASLPLMVSFCSQSCSSHCSSFANNSPPLQVQQYEVLMPLSFALVAERTQSLKWYAAAIAIHYVFTNYRKVRHTTPPVKCLSHVDTN